MKKVVFTIVLVLGVLFAFQFTSPEQSNLKQKSAFGDDVILLELFTSQGCSSCPSADRVLDETLANTDNVIGLSYHVDYWNYIGWKDPFSSKVFSNYQRAYANKFKSSSIYTPQLVVNGSTHFTGSDARSLARNLADKENYIPSSISIADITKSGNSISFNLKSLTEANILTVALVIEERQTKIPRGENRNRTLTNSNIVIAREVLTNTKGKSLSIYIPNIVTAEDTLKLIAYTQDSNFKVLAATEELL